MQPVSVIPMHTHNVLKETFLVATAERRIRPHPLVQIAPAMENNRSNAHADPVVVTKDIRIRSRGLWRKEVRHIQNGG